MKRKEIVIDIKYGIINSKGKILCECNTKDKFMCKGKTCRRYKIVAIPQGK